MNLKNSGDSTGSHVEQYFGIDGRVSCIPFINRLTYGHSLHGVLLLSHVRIEDKALQAVFIELHDSPDLYKFDRKVKATSKGGIRYRNH